MNLLDLTVRITCEDEASGKIETLSNNASAGMFALGTVIANVFSKAMGIVSDSISGAISRVDTLNQYPKVMQSIGYSAEEAESSINKLSDGIDGLPTTLDSIVSVTQTLAPMCDGLDEASDLAIALNDAMLSGGAGTAAASNAITQFTQMLAVGKVDMQAWNSVVTAAPGPMDQLAKSMLGAEANSTNLYNALKDGTLSMDDLVNAVIDLDQNGGNGFASFSEQAGVASEGIQTSIENVKTAITKNLANIIDAFNQSGEISTFFDNIKQIVNDVGAAVADAVPYVVSFVNGLVELSPVLTPLVAAVGAFIGVMTLWQTTTNLVAAAQRALNAVMSANPIILVISIIASLVAALITLYNTNEDFRALVDEVWGAIVTFFTVDVPNAVQGVIEWFQNLPENVSQAMTDAATAVGDWVSGLAEDAMRVGSDFVNTVVEFFTNLPTDIAFALGQALLQISLWAANLANEAAAAGSNFLNGVGSFFASLPTTIYNFLTTALTNIQQWVVSTGLQAYQAGSTFLQNVISFFQNLPGQIWSWLTTTISNVQTFVADMGAKALQAGQDFFDNIVNTIMGIPDRVYEIGSNIVDGIWNGIQDAWDGFVSNVTGLVDNFVGGVMSALGMNSPSKVFRAIGHGVMEGMSLGVEDMEPELTATTSSTVNSMIGAANAVDSPVLSARNSAGNAIVEEVRNLRAAMQNMGIYLDGRTLVGGISDEMDKQLGRKLAWSVTR